VADVTVKVEDDSGNSASGRGMKRDIVVASVEAIVAGTNALLAKKLESAGSETAPVRSTTEPIEGV
jgi:predicted alpha-1,6-mannanase (GH76 family)